MKHIVHKEWEQKCIIYEPPKRKKRNLLAFLFFCITFALK